LPKKAIVGHSLNMIGLTTDGNEPSRGLTAKSAYVVLVFASLVLLLYVYLGKWETGIGAWIWVALV
jgi:hypothetical protein